MIKPIYWDYHTNNGMHSAMLDYAKSKSLPALQCIVTFTDGSTMHEVFERQTKPCFYRVYDKGEGLYSVDIDTSVFKEPFFADRDMKRDELKESFIAWLYKHNKPDEIKTIVWSYSDY